MPRALVLVLSLLASTLLGLAPRPASADDGGTVVVFVTAQGATDKLPEAELQAFEEALRAAAKAPLRALGYRLWDRATLTALVGDGVVARTGCGEACRFGPLRSLQGVGAAPAILDAEVTAADTLSVRIRLLAPGTQAVLATTTLDGATLAALQARLAAELDPVLANSAQADLGARHRPGAHGRGPGAGPHAQAG